MKKHPNYEKLKNSDQWRGSKADTALIAGVVAAALAVTFLFSTVNISGTVEDSGKRLALTGQVLLVLAAVTAVLCGLGLLIEWLSMTRRLESYRFYTVKFDDPHHGWRGTVYFTVTVPDGEGGAQSRDTAAIFAGRATPMDAYLNKNVNIAWNPDTEKLVVLGIAR